MRWGNTPIDERQMYGNKNLIRQLKEAKSTQLSEFPNRSQEITAEFVLPESESEKRRTKVPKKQLRSGTDEQIASTPCRYISSFCSKFVYVYVYVCYICNIYTYIYNIVDGMVYFVVAKSS